ncbi:MAG: ornithine cyclodeaminase family protein [Chloroflexi bacterium]|nr:ornithine cyclodeaminase family protein [Chloroflexota bacterium]
MLIVSDEDVRALLTMSECIETLDGVFKEAAAGTVSNMSRYRVPFTGGSYEVMAAASDELGYGGLKTYVSNSTGGHHMVVLLYSTETAKPVALIAANSLGATRTGAASGIATRYMARAEASTAGIIGSGSQARTQLAAVCSVRPIERVRVYSPTPAHREAFATEMSRELSIAVEAVGSAEAAVAEADVVCVITTAHEPVVDGAAFRDGTHVNAAGAANWMYRELDEAAVRRAELVVVDDLANAKIECGDLIWAAERRVFRWERAVELHDVVGGRVSGRPSPAAITLFESQGAAFEDVAVGALVYRRALERGMGHEVSI